MDPFTIFTLMASIASSAIGAQSQLGANTANVNNSQYLLNQQQNFSREEAEKANQRTIDNYNMLYSPQAKVQQLKEAGLNPALMYANGGVASGGIAGSQAQTPSSNLPQVNAINPTAGLGEIASIAKSLIEKKNSDKQNEKIDAEVKKTMAEFENICQKTNNEQILQQTYELNNQILEITKNYEMSTLEERKEMITASLEKLNAETDKLIEEVYGLEIDNKTKNEMNNAIIENKKAQTEQLLQDKVLKQAQTQVENAKKLLTDEQIKLTKEQREKISLEVKELEQRIEYIELYGYGSVTAHGPVDKAVGGVMDLGKKLNERMEELKKGLPDTWRGNGQKF